MDGEIWRMAFWHPVSQLPNVRRNEVRNRTGVIHFHILNLTKTNVEINSHKISVESPGFGADVFCLLMSGAQRERRNVPVLEIDRNRSIFSRFFTSSSSMSIWTTLSSSYFIHWNWKIFATVAKNHEFAQENRLVKEYFYHASDLG
jgi:hypothetical protein